MNVEIVMVRDKDGNELFIGKDIGDCKEWCSLHNITGDDGEYIAYGVFDTETRYFELTDYETI